jgi:hypothetical protein
VLGANKKGDSQAKAAELGDVCDVVMQPDLTNKAGCQSGIVSSFG